jgi:hypothetical protein
MASLIDRLKKILGASNPGTDMSPTVPVDEATLTQLMQILIHTREDELSCATVAERLDEYVDCISGRMLGDDTIPLMEHHLAMCPDCHEELDALLRAIETAAEDDSP